MLSNNINLTGKTILVTGAAGFIGSNLTPLEQDFGFKPCTPLAEA